MEISRFFCHSDFTWNQFWRMLKNADFTTFWALVNLVNLNLQKSAKIHENQNGTFGEALKWPKLISRKIWMTEKPWNFHSVKIYHFEIFSLWIFFLSILALKNARFAKILFFVVSKKCQNMYNFLKQWRLTHTNSKLFKIEFSFSCLFTMWIQNVPCKNQNP